MSEWQNGKSGTELDNFPHKRAYKGEVVENRATLPLLPLLFGAALKDNICRQRSTIDNSACLPYRPPLGVLRSLLAAWPEKEQEHA